MENPNRQIFQFRRVSRIASTAHGHHGGKTLRVVRGQSPDLGDQVLVMRPGAARQLVTELFNPAQLSEDDLEAIRRYAQDQGWM